MNHLEPRQVATEYWIEHAAMHSGTAAVHPTQSWARYHAWTRHMLQTWTMRRLRAERPRYQRVLDLGCGIGDWTELFATVADEVHACDVAPMFVQQTRRRVPSAHVECHDLVTYRMPRDVDLIHFGAVLMYLPDTDALDVLRRAREAAKPGAVVLWRDYCTFNFGRRTENHGNKAFSIHRRPRDLLVLAERAGFAPIELRSSPSIYGESMGRALQWPARMIWRIATASWLRASHLLILRA